MGHQIASGKNSRATDLDGDWPIVAGRFINRYPRRFQRIAADLRNDQSYEQRAAAPASDKICNCVRTIVYPDLSIGRDIPAQLETLLRHLNGGAHAHRQGLLDQHFGQYSGCYFCRLLVYSALWH